MGEAIRTSTWLFPAIEIVHLLGLALLGGAILLLDLRLLGVGLAKERPAMLELQTRPWLLAAIATLVVSGVPMFLAEAGKLYGKEAYWLKMAFLVLALAFTFAVRNPLARRDPPLGAMSRCVGIASIALWLGVACSGRWIGFS